MKHPSNYLWELYYGGVVKFGNIRIGGRPGSPEFTNLEINTNWAILKGHPNYNESDIDHSIYHACA